MRVKRKSCAEIRYVVALILVLCAACGQAASSNNNILLTVDEVKEIMSRQEVTLVDARPFIAFKRGHIQGAVSMPTDETFTKKGRSDLVASLPEMRDLMNHAGVTQQSQIIVYGGRNFLDISRLFWVLETFGVKKVAIMNSSFSEWKKLGYPTEKGELATKKTDVYPTLKEEKLATMLMVFAAITKESEGLVDARSEQEYSGQQSQTAVFGHIPSAINIPWASNLTKNYSSFRPIDELKELYKGVIMNQMNTVYCNQGKESAVNYVALRVLGANVRAYDGSWFEWSQQSGLPIAPAE